MEKQESESNNIQDCEEKAQVVPESEQPESANRPVEIGGRKGPEPTRYGDWEKNGRCIDF